MRQARGELSVEPSAQPSAPQPSAQPAPAAEPKKHPGSTFIYFSNHNTVRPAIVAELEDECQVTNSRAIQERAGKWWRRLTDQEKVDWTRRHKGAERCDAAVLRKTRDAACLASNSAAAHHFKLRQ